MIAILIIGWAIVVAAMLTLAFLLAVGAAVSRRQSPGVKRFIDLMLTPGINVSRGNPFIFLPMLWLAWTAIGAAAIVGIRALR